MKIKLRLFSIAKDLAGFESRIVDLPTDSSVDAVLAHLTNVSPQFQAWKKSIRLAVNQEYAELNDTLHENDEVAVIPPVSGG